jgi:hypothetical protein
MGNHMGELLVVAACWGEIDFRYQMRLSLHGMDSRFPTACQFRAKRERAVPHVVDVHD